MNAGRPSPSWRFACSRSRSIGFSFPSTSKCQKVQPLQAVLPWTIRAEPVDRSLLAAVAQRAVCLHLGADARARIEQRRSGLKQSQLDNGAERHARLGCASNAASRAPREQAG